MSSPCLGQAESQRRESREAMALDETIIGGRYLKSDQRERFKRGPVEAKNLPLILLETTCSGNWRVPP